MNVKKLRKVNTILIFCFALIVGLYFAAPILVPFVFAVFFASLILPISEFLERKFNAGRITSSFVSTFILLVGVGLILFFLIRQLGLFIDDLVTRKEELLAYVDVLREKIMSVTGITLQEQKDIFQARSSEFFDVFQTFLKNFLAGVTAIVVKFLVVLLYVLLLLINRDKFLKFLMMYTSEEKKKETKEIVSQLKNVANKYLWGRLQVMIILGIMYAITFYSYGLEHATLLLIFGVIVTIIPYLGPFISGLLPIIFMILFGGGTLEIVSFTVIVVIIQLIESYVLEPIIIGSEVQQSPLFVIIAILIGGALWGAAGLILFVPIFGMLKILFDHNKSLKPIGFLIGYERPGAKENIVEKVQRKIKN